MGKEITTIATQDTSLTTVDARRAYLAETIPADVIESLNRAHGTFFGALACQDLTDVEKMMLTARATNDLRELFKGAILENLIMPLQGSAIGFKVDREGGYGQSVVLECAVEATLRGLPLVGNCFNILGGNLYVPKEGFEHLVGQMCSYSLAFDVPPVPKEFWDMGGYLTVPVKIYYRRHTDPEESEAKVFKRSFKVRVNKRTSVVVENVQGKATRKALKELYRELTGIGVPDAEDMVEGEAGTAGVHQLGAHHGNAEDSSGVAPSVSETVKKAREGVAKKADPDRQRQPGEDDEDREDLFG